VRPRPCAACPRENKLTKLVLLTAKGQREQDPYRKLLVAIEAHWRARFGEETINNLRESLEHFVVGPPVDDRSASEPDDEQSPLFRGLQPYPDNWRAKRPRPTTLPNFPMVLHRGGFPDGCLEVLRIPPVPKYS